VWGGYGWLCLGIEHCCNGDLISSEFLANLFESLVSFIRVVSHTWVSFSSLPRRVVPRWKATSQAPFSKSQPYSFTEYTSTDIFVQVRYFYHLNRLTTRKLGQWQVFCRKVIGWSDVPRMTLQSGVNFRFEDRLALLHWLDMSTWFCSWFSKSLDCIAVVWCGSVHGISVSSFWLSFLHVTKSSHLCSWSRIDW